MAPTALSDLSSPPATAAGLTPSQLQQWHEDGYLIMPDYLSPETVSSLLGETHTLLSSFDLASHPLTKFTTGDESTAHVGDDYFLTSGDKIRFFFEEGAFVNDDNNSSDDGRPTPRLSKPKERAINKIGHNLHALSPPFRHATLTARNAAVARAIGFQDPRVLQSMVICKQPEIGGRVPPHQDSTFLYTDPPSAVGFWFALEDATVENGCLSFARGSHRRAPVKTRFVRSGGGAAGAGVGAGGGTTFVDVEGERWPAGLEHGGGAEEGQEEEYTLGEVKAGSLVLIHGNLLHKSEKNTSQKGRIIYTFHMIEGGHEYDERNWLLRPKEGFTKLFA